VMKVHKSLWGRDLLFDRLLSVAIRVMILENQVQRVIEQEK
jgi:hypothetical protein